MLSIYLYITFSTYKLYISQIYFYFFPIFSMNAPVMVELEGETDPLQIAMKELKYN